MGSQQRQTTGPLVIASSGSLNPSTNSTVGGTGSSQHEQTNVAGGTVRRRSDYENGGRRSTGEAFAQRVKLIHDWDLGEKRPFYDIDTKHQKEQAFEAEIAEELFAYLREIELIKRPSDDAELQTAIPRPGFRKERMRAVNFLFSNVHALMTTTNTVHVAMYYFDRFYEKYDGKAVKTATVIATALHLASKYEQIDPVSIHRISSLMKPSGTRALSISAVLKLEGDFLMILSDFLAPTATNFVHRFMQSVDMEMHMSAVYMARYYSSLAMSHFSLSGYRSSKLAAAAAFIAFNHYVRAPISTNASGEDESHIQFPAALKHHCGYSLAELEPIVLQLVELAREMEKTAFKPVHEKEALPYAVYNHYRIKGVVSTYTLPDFGSYFRDMERAQIDDENDEENNETKAIATLA